MRSSTYSPGTGKPGPLVGSPVSHDSGETGGDRSAAESVLRELLKRQDVLAIWELHVNYVKSYKECSRRNDEGKDL